MFPDLNALQSVVWSKTANDSLSQESIIRRLLTITTSEALANIFKVDEEYVESLDSKNYEDYREVKNLAITLTNNSMSIIKERRNIYDGGFYTNLIKPCFIAKVFNMTVPQYLELMEGQ